ncbi:alpha/beta fold hydrolase [bacterium]|nr:alpha/beta fold hydrolase [bacterium]
MRRRTLAFLLIGTLLASGCSAPVGVKRLSPQDQHRQLASNALTADAPSDAAQIVLRRYNLAATYEDQPELALTTLRAATFGYGGGSDELFALAELSYRYAERTDSRPYALAAALYAYAFLFPVDPAVRPQPVDARYRWAADIYAAGLTKALTGPKGKTMQLRGGTYPLPWGTADISFDASETEWSGRMLSDFVTTAQYQVHGLNNRYRQAGIGVPLAARPLATDQTDGGDLVSEEVRVPATAVLRIDDPRRQIASDTIHGNLDVYAVDERDTVDINGVPVPLEIDRSATLAVSLAEVGFWRQELSAFLGDAIGTRRTARLFAREPYHPGRIPIVLVHGTNSSPGRWADMVNDLENDPRIRRRYQFWFFSYDSGNPIVYSAMLLRRALTEAVAHLDPDDRDPCLRQMVVMGHSQGGLLTKMTVVDAGDAFWRNVSDNPFDQAKLTPSTRALIREALFVQPLPFVRRVIFISTPHRGSYLASYELVGRLAARLISMPRDVLSVSTELIADPSTRAMKMQRIPTSLDNMSPTQPFIKTLAGLPITPGVNAHSIIPVLGDGPLDDEVDGVVAYKSAHIEGVDSEVVIHHSGHSTQSDARTIDEVRRILLLHTESANCGQTPPRVTVPLQPASTKPGAASRAGGSSAPP